MTLPAEGQDAGAQAIPVQRHLGFLVASVQTDLSLPVLDRFAKDMLARLQREGARAVIVDMQEVAIVDAVEFGRLVAIGSMARVMGARFCIAGLQPGVVAGLVQEEFDLSHCQTTLSVEDAMAVMQAAP